MLQLHFEQDIREEFIRLSKKMNFKLKDKQDFYSFLLDYFTVRFKLIEPKKRKVRISQQLIKDLPNHDKKKEIITIIDIAREGGNLNIFQSKKLLQTNFHDHLQNEWNIYHFHVSLELERKSNYVKQVDSLLFVYISDTDIVFLGTDVHKRKPFGDVKWVQILHDNFPELIKEYRREDITEVSPKVTSIDRQTFGDKGLSLVFTQLENNVIYMNPGVGRVTTGHSNKVVDHVISISRWLFTLEKQIKENIDILEKIFKRDKSKLHFKIQIRDSKVALIEIASNFELLYFPNGLKEREELMTFIK